MDGYQRSLNIYKFEFELEKYRINTNYYLMLLYFFYVEVHPPRHNNECLSLEEKKNPLEQVKEQIQPRYKYCNVNDPVCKCTVVSNFWNVVRQTEPTSKQGKCFWVVYGLNFSLRRAKCFRKKVYTFTHHNRRVYIEGGGKHNEQGSKKESATVFPKEIVEFKQ